MSKPRYDVYRRTGVEWLGRAPGHWPLVPLKRQVRLVTQKAEERVNPVGLENIAGWTGRFIETETEFEGEGVAFESGDVLFGKLRPYLAKVYLADHRGEAVGDFHVLRPQPGFDGRFLRYWLLNRDCIDVIDGSTFGSKMPRASWEFMGALKVPTPSLEEQVVIASFLDEELARIDTLCCEQRRLIELLDEKRHALISHVVTKGPNPDAPMKASGIEWLGEIPVHWELGGLTKFLESLVDYRGRTPTKVDEGVLLLTARNIRDGAIDYEASAEYVSADDYADVMRRGKPGYGDVLFTTEAPLGQVANVDRTDIALAQRIIKFRGRSGILSNEYLKYWLLGRFAQAEMEKLATGSTALGIKGSKVGQLRICIPPLSEQHAIVARLNTELQKLSRLLTEAKGAIDLLQERRVALISAAVTGQIDVRALAVAGVA